MKTAIKTRQWGNNKALPEFAGKVDLKVHLGCGNDVREGFVNIDKTSQPIPGIVRVDMEKGWLPFDDNSVSLVECHHVFEHIHNLLPLMNEIHRVLKRGGILNASTPVYPYAEAFQDPTHVRYFTLNTWRYFVDSELLWKEVGKNYGIQPFRIYNQYNSGVNLHVKLVK